MNQLYKIGRVNAQLAYLTSMRDKPCSRGASNKVLSFSKLLFLLLVLAGSPLAQAQNTGLPEGFVEERIGGNWNAAVGLTFSSDGNRIYVWEKGGKVWIVEDGQKLPDPLIDISDEVGDWGDHGLLGFALDPDFDNNGYIYLLYAVDRHHLMNYGTGSYSPTANAYREASIGRLARYTVNPANNRTAVDVNSRRILIGETKSDGIPILYESHGVGSLVFGEDGSLLVSTGDGASAGGVDYGYREGNTDANAATDNFVIQALEDGIINQQQNVGAFKSQLIESLNGKILRIDPATGNGIASNPYYDGANPKSAASRVWALGLRNPFRFSVKPGTGNSDFPGIIYTGDTGWNRYEEINVVTGPGMNFGWPIYEGLEPMEYYLHRAVANPIAANPMYGQGNCTQEFFTFQNLLQQPKRTTKPYFGNPCNWNTPIPASVHTFIHSRPSIEWGNGSGGARTGVFEGEEAAVALIGAANSPVSGPQFNGSSPTGGVWYTGTTYPEEYRDTYFFGDYGAAWIKNASFNAIDEPTAVRDFKDNNAIVVGFAAHPVTGDIYYVDYARGVHKLSYYAGNMPPVAEASADKLYGQVPLTVRFKGSDSSDPENKALTYAWDFGDGSPVSNEADPEHTFTGTGTAEYEVVLTVTDPEGLSSTAKLSISVNNTPPAVKITSPAAGTEYTVTGGLVTYDLRAEVSDAEHSGEQLTYAWRTVLHHNDHNHPEPIDNNPETTSTVTTMGCDGETYFYRFHLTVTDEGGLSSSDFVDVYPDCSGGVVRALNIASPVDNSTHEQGAPIDFTVSFTDPNREWSKVEYLNGNTLIAEVTTAPYSYTWENAAAGVYTITARATDTDNHSLSSDPITITVGDGGVIELENCLPGIQHYFSMDEETGESLSDFASAITATCTACPEPVEGIFKGAQRFNGDNTGVDINNANNFDWAADDSFTIDLWMRSDENVDGNTVILGRNIGASGLHWWVGLNQQGQAVFMLRDINHAGAVVGGTGPDLVDGEWHHLIAIRDKATNKNMLYVDGTLIGETVYTYTNNFSGQAKVTIGYMDRDAGFNYRGDIEELKLYNRALTATEIAGSYNGGEGSYCGTTVLSAKGNRGFSGTFEVYPNPSAGTASVGLFVSSLAPGETVRIALVDLTGRVVLEKRMTTTPDGTLSGELKPGSKLSAGIYSITISDNSRTISRKLVVLE